MERINIIGGGNVTIQYAQNFSKVIKTTKDSFRISKVASNDIVIHLNGIIEFLTKMDYVTIQENNTSPAIQLTPDNWDSLTNGLIESAGGGAGTGSCDVSSVNTLTGDVVIDSADIPVDKTDLSKGTVLNMLLEIPDKADDVQPPVAMPQSRLPGAWVNSPHIPFIRGTQTAITNQWTGKAPTINALVEGQSIIYYLPFNGNATPATLNLQLADGTWTGELPCRHLHGANVSTHFANYAFIFMVYANWQGTQASPGWTVIYAYDSDTTAALSLNYRNPIMVGDTIYRYKICFIDTDGKIYPIFPDNKTLSTVLPSWSVTNKEIPIGAPLLYYNATPTLNAGETTSLTHTAGFIVYYFNINVASLVIYKNLYLRGKIGPGGGFLVDPVNYWTQDLPAVDDGYYYMYLGVITTGTYIIFTVENPVYYFRNGMLQVYTQASEETPVRVITMVANTVTVDFEIKPYVDYVFINDVATRRITVTDSKGVARSGDIWRYNESGILMSGNWFNQGGRPFKCFWSPLDGGYWVLSTARMPTIATAIENSASTVPVSKIVYDLQQSITEWARTKQLPGSTNNLNTLVDNGLYAYGTGASGSPSPTYDGFVIVTNSGTMIMQLSFFSSRIYFRSSTNGGTSWGNWSYTANNNDISSINTLIATVEAIARGRSRGIVFDTLAQLDSWLGGATIPGITVLPSELSVGDNFFIRDTGVPDFWWDGTARLPLESEKVDLTGFYTKTEADGRFVLQIAGKGLSDKNFTAAQERLANFRLKESTVTSLLSLPVDGHIVYADISANGSLAVTASPPAGFPLGGQDIHVVVRNTSASQVTVAIPTSGVYDSLDGNTLTIKANSRAEVNLLYSSNESKWIISFKAQQ